MRASSIGKVLGGVAVISALGGGAFFFWRAERPPVASAVASAEPCGSVAEACGAHAPRAVPSAARIEGRPRMLVFSSKSCAACKRMEPLVEQALEACGGGRDVLRVDYDDEKGEALAETYEVSLLPSFLSVDATGHEVSRLTGVQPPEQLEHALEEIRGVRCALVEHDTSAKPM